MRSNIQHQKLPSLLFVVCVFSLANLGLAETPPFSFDKALQIYNDVNTASQLTQYLQSASSDDKKDYRYTLYRIRGYYANYQFENGDALVEKGVLGARHAGLIDTQVDVIRVELKKQRDYWQNRLQEQAMRRGAKSNGWSSGETHTGSGGRIRYLRDPRDTDLN
jgi:hypothetical protein